MSIVRSSLRFLIDEIDKPMQLNHGKFRGNGRCGYILRPEFMFAADFEPNNLQKTIIKGIKPSELKIKVSNILRFRLQTQSKNMDRIVEFTFFLR